MSTALNDINTHTVDQLGEKLGRLKADFREVVGLARDIAGERLAGLKDSALDNGKATVARVSTAIEDNPFRSVAIAVGVGALIGFLVSRR